MSLLPFKFGTHRVDPFAGPADNLAKTSLSLLKKKLGAMRLINFNAFAPPGRISVLSLAKPRKAEATISNAVDFGAIGNSLGVPGFVPGHSDQSATLSGDAWAFGYKAGFTWTATPALRFGMGYQARTNIAIKGHIAYSAVPAPFNATISDSAAQAEAIGLPADHRSDN